MTTHEVQLPEWAVQKGRAFRPPRPMDATRTALIAIDIQNFFTEPGYAFENPHAAGVISRTNAIAAALRSAGGTVVFTQQCSERRPEAETPRAAPMSGSESSRVLRGHLAPGQPGFELNSALEVHESDLVVTKYRPSAFHRYSASGLEDVLTERGIDSVIITGLITTGCCYATALDAYQSDFRVLFASDANACMSDEEQAAALLLLSIWFADVRTTDELLAGIAGDPGFVDSGAVATTPSG